MIDPDEAMAQLEALASAEVGEESPFMSVAEIEGEKPAVLPGEPGWSDFVRSHFKEGETDDQGNPYVAGLRRVTRLLLGPIIQSYPEVIQAPRLECDGDGRMYLTPTTYKHTVVVRLVREGVDALFAEVADVYYVQRDGRKFANTDPEYAIHASATCSTKAEARALRKLLQLSGVVAAEERLLVPIEEMGLDGLLTSAQACLIKQMCRQLSIDVSKFINMTGGNFQSDLSDVPSETADRMIQELHRYRHGKREVPAKVRV